MALSGVPVQRSASFNASSTVPLKITILDETGNESRRSSGPYCVKNSKSLSNCSLISKIVSKADGTRSIISHTVPSKTHTIPIDGASNQNSPLHNSVNCDRVAKIVDYYV